MMAKSDVASRHGVGRLGLVHRRPLVLRRRQLRLFTRHALHCNRVDGDLLQPWEEPFRATPAPIAVLFHQLTKERTVLCRLLDNTDSTERYDAAIRQRGV